MVDNGTATPVNVTTPFEDFEVKGTASELTNWINARLDSSAKSVELFRRIKQGKRQLIARVWRNHV